MFSFEEQRQWMMRILDDIGAERLWAMWKGNHDHKWERKTGVSKYAGLAQRYNCPIFYGNAYVGMKINDDIRLQGLGSHRLRGNSIYSNAHPSTRAAMREVQDLDFAFCGHVHKRGEQEQPVRSFDGAKLVWAIVNGTYQLGSEYTKDSGYGIQRGPELGMYWMIFNHDKKMIRVEDTDKMLETMRAYL
jgi:hypothetical protein